MGIKDMIKQMGVKSKERKEKLRLMLEQDRLEKTVLERSKSSNLRELERYYKEDQDKMIKEQLMIARKKRSDDIRFNHNPIDAENIMTKTKWHVLREKNQFSNNKNIFENQRNIHRTNTNLMKSGNVLHGRNLFKNKGGGLI